jgi:hypothetical protein
MGKVIDPSNNYHLELQLCYCAPSMWSVVWFDRKRMIQIQRKLRLHVTLQS